MSHRPGWSPIVRVTAMSMCLMLKHMKDKPCTYSFLTEQTGLHDRTVRKWVAEMHRQGLVYIEDWEKRIAATGTHAPNYAPMWRWRRSNAQVDAPKPKSGVTKAERNRQYKARKKRERELQANAFERTVVARL